MHIVTVSHRRLGLLAGSCVEHRPNPLAHGTTEPVEGIRSIDSSRRRQGREAKAGDNTFSPIDHLGLGKVSHRHLRTILDRLALHKHAACLVSLIALEAAFRDPST